LRRPGHLIQHSITLLLGRISHTAWRYARDRCPVEKQIIFLLSANQMGWGITAESCGSHVG
jgi:hypothetical protein